MSQIGEKGLRAILNKKLVDNLSNYSISKKKLCEQCVFGKHNRSSFPKGIYKAKRSLEIIHSDVCGLVDVFLWVNLDIMFPLLMISQDTLGFILCTLNMKFSPSLRNLRP